MMADDAPKLATLTYHVLPAFTIRSLLFAKLKLAASTPMDHPSSPQKSAWCFRNKNDVHQRNAPENSAKHHTNIRRMGQSPGAKLVSASNFFGLPMALDDHPSAPSAARQQKRQAVSTAQAAYSASRAQQGCYSHGRYGFGALVLPGQEEIVKMDTLGKNQFMHQFYQL